MPPKAQSKMSAKAQKAKAKKERQLLEARIRECQEKCTEARGFLEPTGRNAEPNFAKAKVSLDAAVEAYDAFPLAYFILGQWHRMQGLYNEAIESYSSALDLEPTNVPALEWRASCYQAQHDYVHAIEDNTSIIALDPENDHAYNMRGLCMLQSSVPGLRLRTADFQSCERDFRTAVRLNEANYYAMTNLGKVHEDQGLFEQAIDFYGKALNSSENYSYARLRRGCVALRVAEMSILRQEGRSASSDDDAPAAAAGAAAAASHGSPSQLVAAAAAPSVHGRRGGGATSLREVKAEVRQQMKEEEEAQTVVRLLKQADSDFTSLLDTSPDAKKLTADVAVVLNIGICALLSKNVHRAEEYLKLAQEIVAKRPGLVEAGEAPPLENADTVKSVLAIRLNELHSLKEATRSVV
ncbi:tetratricopeptide repeat (TPR) protein [Novymonas esmeraldas]|uniref:Tetratricopeptide repeat (TPR) protein n=1 Tax=Novymonas esmeraldas TaxID=1808958 RepID=A0AAW0EK40_9TRYP